MSDHPVDERYEMSAELFALRAEVARLRDLLNEVLHEHGHAIDSESLLNDIDAALGTAGQPSAVQGCTFELAPDCIKVTDNPSPSK